MPGIRPGNHGDAHRLPFHAHARSSSRRTLATMTERTLRFLPKPLRTSGLSRVSCTPCRTKTSAADAALDDNLVYQNVGLPTIHGRRKAINLFRRMEGRGGFEVKFHRIAADGAAVLTEHTDALIVGPLRLQSGSAACSRCTMAESRCGGTTSTCSTWLRRPCVDQSGWRSRRCGRRSKAPKVSAIPSSNACASQVAGR